MAKAKRLPSDWSYAAAVNQVEIILDEIESGSLSLEEVFRQFETAITQLNHCEQFLAQGKTQMEVSIEVLEAD